MFYDFPHELLLFSGDSWNIRNGQQAVFSNERPLRSTIGNDKSAAIAQLKRELEQLQKELQSTQREADQLDGQHSEYQRSWNVCRKAQRKNTETMNKLVDQIDQIKVEMEAASGNTIDTSEYEEDVAQQTENVQKYGEEKERAANELEGLKPGIEEIKTKINENQRRSEKILEELTAAEGEMTKFLETQSQRKDVVAKKREKIEKYMQVIRMHAEKIETIESETNDALYKARKLQYRLKQRKEAQTNSASQGVLTGEEESLAEPTQDELEGMTPSNVDKSVDYYSAKVARTQEKIQQERENRRLNDEDPAEAYQKYIEAKEACNMKLKEINRLDETVDEYEKDLKDRRKRWKQFRAHLEKKTDEKFQELLLMNKYMGSLDFSHEDKELNLNVQKQSSGAASQSNDVKGLR